MEPLKKLPGQRLHFVTEARECKYDQLAFKHFLRPQYFVENINADKLDCRPEVPEGVKVRELLREYVALEDEEAQEGKEKDQVQKNNLEKLEHFLQKTLLFATVELWCHPELRNHCKQYYK